MILSKTSWWYLLQVSRSLPSTRASPHCTSELANGGVAAEHRPDILPLITRVLFARLSDRKGAAGSTKLLAVRRAATLTFMSNFLPEELETLCNLMIQPFSRLLSLGQTPESAPRGAAASRALATVEPGNTS
jgi:hypothetical protein